MKIIVIGAVAAGTSAAAKARRNDDHAEIVIYERDNYISYSGCGMPYFIGDEIDEINPLTPRDPKFFKKKYNIDVKIHHEVTSVDTNKKSVEVKDLLTGEVFIDTFDKLIFATGATPFKPAIKGIDQENIFFLRNIKDAIQIKDFIKQNNPKSAVIAGTGFIGFELLENIMQLGIQVHVIEVANKITPNLDEDMANYLENSLLKKGVQIQKNTQIQSIDGINVNLSNGSTIEADFVILSTGVRPNTTLAQSAGIEIGTTGAILVNDTMETNIPNIYACGDCIETYSQITGKKVYRPLGSTANKTGRIAGDCATGGNLKYRGNLGTGIFKLWEFTVATTGLGEKEAITQGFDIQICHNIKPNKPEYMGGKEMIIKAIADKATSRILGVQIIGQEGVDKRIDVFATLITYKATVDELFHLDLAYAPPFSTTKDPVHYTGMILENALNQGRPLITAEQVKNLKNVQLIDARSNSDYENKGTVEAAKNIPHGTLRKELHTLDKELPTVTFCNKGVTGNAAQNILIGNGFKEVYNLSGGHRFYKESK